MNEDLFILKEELKKYLLVVSTINHVGDNLNYCAKSPIPLDIISDPSYLKKLIAEKFIKDIDKEIKAENCYILNFNYTSLHYNLSNITDIIDIHGQLNNIYNPMIFGYGDEVDDDYNVIEKTNLNEFLVNIKSFGYFLNTNYQRLLSILEEDDFIIDIWGHSCSLSDRTLLNMVFEHDNCKAIRPYYWQKPDGSDNYLELTHNISRHFKNKQKMRIRVVNKEKCRPLGSQF